jgi:hypothetical protein
VQEPIGVIPCCEIVTFGKRGVVDLVSHSSCCMMGCVVSSAPSMRASPSYAGLWFDSLYWSQCISATHQPTWPTTSAHSICLQCKTWDAYRILNVDGRLEVAFATVLRVNPLNLDSFHPLVRIRYKLMSATLLQETSKIFSPSVITRHRLPVWIRKVRSGSLSTKLGNSDIYFNNSGVLYG